MKIVFTTKGNSWESMMDPRFGRSEMFLVYDDEADILEEVSNSETEAMQHGVGMQTSKKMINLKADVVITGNGAGGNALGILRNTGIKLYMGAGNMSVRDTYDAFKNGNLKAQY